MSLGKETSIHSPNKSTISWYQISSLKFDIVRWTIPVFGSCYRMRSGPRVSRCHWLTKTWLIGKLSTSGFSFCVLASLDKVTSQLMASPAAHRCLWLTCFSAHVYIRSKVKVAEWCALVWLWRCIGSCWPHESRVALTPGWVLVSLRVQSIQAAVKLRSMRIPSLLFLYCRAQFTSESSKSGEWTRQ